MSCAKKCKENCAADLLSFGVVLLFPASSFWVVFIFPFFFVVLVLLHFSFFWVVVLSSQKLSLLLLSFRNVDTYMCKINTFDKNKKGGGEKAVPPKRRRSRQQRPRGKCSTTPTKEGGKQHHPTEGGAKQHHPK